MLLNRGAVQDVITHDEEFAEQSFEASLLRTLGAFAQLRLDAGNLRLEAFELLIAFACVRRENEGA